MSDITICVLSAVEPPLPECLQAVDAQLGGPYRVIRVHDVVPMSEAFNEFVRRSAPSKFVVQVDADVVLHIGAVETLYTFIRNKPWLYMAWGQLYEEGFGLGGAVRIWRRWPARLFRFRDKRCVDRDYHSRVRLIGLRRQQVKWSDAPEQPFGTHFPRQSEFAKFSKARGNFMKWSTLGRWDLVREKYLKRNSIPTIEDWGRYSASGASWEEAKRSKDALKDKREFDALTKRGGAPHA